MFYETVKKLCEEKNISVNGLTKILRISQSNNTNWSNGMIPKSDVVVKIADYFDVSTDYLLGRTKIKKAPAVSDEELLAAMQSRPLLKELIDVMDQMDDESLSAFVKILQAKPPERK